jgi:glycerophosphoryl diester phosphodiesterase
MLLVHGHRGARAVLPENTLPAFAHAISAGADYIEMDVAVTHDDVPVISHDPVLPSGAAIRQLTLPKLRRLDASIPTLDEVLALRNICFNIEMKSFADKPEFTPPPGRCAGLLLDAIRRRDLCARVIVQSFDFRVLRAMRSLAPQIRLAALVETGEPDFVAATRAAVAEIIAPEYRMVTRQKVVDAHAAGIDVVPWTVNAEPAWARMVECGVDGIITDDPAALIRWLRVRGLRG